jgi:hypothetical protein
MYEIVKISLIAFMISATIQQKKSLLAWYRKLIKKLPWYLYFPLGGCYKCFVGQFCLWYFLIKSHFIIQGLNQWIDFGFFISTGIFSAMIYNKIYCWLCE